MRLNWSKALVLVAAAMPFLAHASPIDDLPIFYSMLDENPKYREAAFKAQQAMLLQVGITPVVDRTISYVAKEADSTTRHVIDSYTPFESKQVYFLVGTAYALGIKKEISARFRNPLFKQVNHTLTLGKNSQTFGLTFPF